MTLPRVGLTGGIGSGKTAVAARLAARGAVVVDADELARAALRPGTDALAAVVARFGPQVLDADGGLDRAALAGRVFADPADRAALERIVHPVVAAESERRFAAAPPGTVLVHDVPLLAELGLERGYDAVLVVEAPLPARLERLGRDRGMTADEALARIASQASDEERRAVATFVVVNDGSLAELDARVGELWPRLRTARRLSDPPPIVES